MLFMITRTWESGKIPEIMEKHGEIEKSGPPAGMEIIGQWMYLGGRKVFTLCEVRDSTPLIQYGRIWGSLMTIDIMPVTDGRLI